jgi:hypothetical protein
MIAVQPTSLDLARRAPSLSAAVELECARSASPPADMPARVSAQFRPLDPGIVSEAIPAFFIGRNKEGFWVARDAKGRIGGLFLLENSALSFARKCSWPGGCVTIFPSEKIELDLANSGNPLIAQIEPLRRLALRLRLRIAGFTGNLTETVKRRLRNFHDL